MLKRFSKIIFRTGQGSIGRSNDSSRYDDIIDLPHFESKNPLRMSIQNRAAQFAPFAALTGYDAAVKETARLITKRIELDDDTKILLNGKLQLIQDNIKSHPEVTICYFLPDDRKRGGAYVDVTGDVSPSLNVITGASMSSASM